MSKKLQKIVIVVGPTASGKTALSLFLAQKLNGEIISADSRQIYKGLDIGTEKITKAQMGDIPHHLIDIVTPIELYTAADWKRDATHAITKITEQKHVPIVAGGTFFYVEALLGLSLPPVPPNSILRARLEERTTNELFSELKELNALRAETIDPKNRRRLIRALEIVDALGDIPPYVKKSIAPYDTFIIGIRTEIPVLKERIKTRLSETLENGLIDETEALLASGISKERLNEIGLEYRVVIEFLDGKLTKEQMLKKLEQKVWQYAKRQLTWLKRMENVRWYEREETEKVCCDLQEFLES